MGSVLLTRADLKHDKKSASTFFDVAQEARSQKSGYKKSEG